MSLTAFPGDPDGQGFPSNQRIKSPPITSVHPGSPGQWTVDGTGNFIYFCYAPNRWSRIPSTATWGGIGDIPNLVARYQMSQYDAIPNNTEEVSCADSSGHAFTASTAGGAGSRPVVALAALGSWTALRNNIHVPMTNTISTLSSAGYSMASVFKQAGNGYSLGIDNGSSAGIRCGITQNQGAGTDRWEVTVPNFGNYYTSVAVALNVWHKIIMVADNTATPKIKLYIDGALMTWIANPGGTLGTGSSTSTQILGSAQGSNCDNYLIEHFIYSAPLSDSDRITLDTYFANTYGL